MDCWGELALLLCGAPQTIQLHLNVITNPVTLTSLAFSSTTQLQLLDQEHVAIAIKDGASLHGSVRQGRLEVGKTDATVAVRAATVELQVMAPAEGYLVHDVRALTQLALFRDFLWFSLRSLAIRGWLTTELCVKSCAVQLTVTTRYGVGGASHETTTTAELRFSRPFSHSLSLAFADNWYTFCRGGARGGSEI